MEPASTRARSDWRHGSRQTGSSRRPFVTAPRIPIRWRFDVVRPSGGSKELTMVLEVAAILGQPRQLLG